MITNTSIIETPDKQQCQTGKVILEANEGTDGNTSTTTEMFCSNSKIPQLTPESAVTNERPHASDVEDPEMMLPDAIKPYKQGNLQCDIIQANVTKNVEQINAMHVDQGPITSVVTVTKEELPGCGIQVETTPELAIKEGMDEVYGTDGNVGTPEGKQKMTPHVTETTRAKKMKTERGDNVMRARNRSKSRHKSPIN